MIVPIAFSVRRKDQPESFVVNSTDLLRRPPDADVRVTLVLMDIDSGEVNGFSARVLLDQTAEPYHELMPIFRRPEGQGIPSWGSREYVTRVRDALNELLEEA